LRRPGRNYVPLANLIGIIFQILDDYLNLQSSTYATNKGYCEDLSEGKFSFPVVHSIRADSSNRQILNILRARPKDVDTKAYAVKYMDEVTNSFEYTRKVLDRLMLDARGEVAKLGGNEAVGKILDKLEAGWKATEGQAKVASPAVDRRGFGLVPASPSMGL